MKNRLQTIFWMACILFLTVPNSYSQLVPAAANHSAGAARSMPPRPPSGQISPANCCHTWTGHVFYISYGDRHVHELYYYNNGYNGAWSDHDLTALTNGPQAVGAAITSFFDGSLEHVFYVSSHDSHVRELYYNGAWWGNDLTAATNGPQASAESITSLFDGSLDHVFYVGWDGHVRELYYNGAWWGNDLTAATNAPPCQGYQGWGMTSLFDGSLLHVFYLSQDDHVCELYYTGAWWGNDLTAATNGPLAEGKITSLFDGSRVHVFYTSGADQHVRELYYTGNWWGNDLTAATNGPLAREISITSSFDGSLEHVFYVSYRDSHVRELYYDGGWWGNDLTAKTNGPLAEHLSAITSSFGVFYISDFDVHELHSYSWGTVDTDLTAATNGPSAEYSPLTSFVAY